MLASVAVVVILGLTNGMAVSASIRQHFLSWPIIFFASVMVTEPLTLPPRLYQQILYGTVIGALSSWPLALGPVYMTPELALLLGNLYAYATGLRRRLKLSLQEKKVIARETYEFVFDLDRPLIFLPGQYLEWTLPHPQADGRGNRRYFPIASSPTEKDIRLGVKIGENGSSFKRALREMRPGDVILAGQLGGDFVLPNDPKKPLVFVAGGIGITPFRSMIKYLIDKGERRDIVLFYGARTEGDAAYRDILQEAERVIGLKTVYLIGERFEASSVSRHVSDYTQRKFYLSGPSSMVDSYRSLLRTMGVPRSHVVSDYFPGFA